MIKSKKMVIAAALCAFTAAISFAQEVSFENKLSSGLVNIDIINGDSDTSFAGITNEAEAGYGCKAYYWCNAGSW